MKQGQSVICWALSFLVKRFKLSGKSIIGRPVYCPLVVLVDYFHFQGRLLKSEIVVFVVTRVNQELDILQNIVFLVSSVFFKGLGDVASYG